MARRSAREALTIVEDKFVKPKSALEYGRYAMKVYGSEVIEDRALPDFRDGLKPVQRRILWSMYKQNLKSTSDHVKSARTVGDVIAKYHPHGDSSVYSTMVTMANSAVPTVDGKGNWGGLFESAAAYRYTNARMSKYAQEIFFNSHLASVMNLVPNFDDKEDEPLILNAMLPNVLINGSFGIGVAVTSNIPCYTLESIANVVGKILAGTPCTPKMCIKLLEFATTSGGEVDKENSELETFYKTGHGSVRFTSDIRFNEEARELTIYGIAPDVNVPKQLERLQDNKAVDRIIDETSLENGYRWRIKLSKSLPRVSVADEVQKICKVFDTTQHYKVNITERLLNARGEPEVSFRNTTVPDLLNDWVKWRLEVELRSLAHQQAQTHKEIDYVNLLILAAANRKVVIAALEHDNPSGYLSKQLKITEENANVILDLKVRQLSKLDANKMKEKLKSLQDHNKQLAAYIKAPNTKVSADLKVMLAAITKGKGVKK